MRTNEVEKITGLTKHAILYYEKVGIIRPKRTNNGYRNYSHDDLQTLKLVKFLRNLDISINDIKAILNNKCSLDDCLKIHKRNIDQTISELEDLQNTISTFKDMHIPLIPALENIKLVPEKKGLGYRKTSKTIAYNRPLTRAMAIRQVISAGIIASIFTYGIYIWIWSEKWYYLENLYFVAVVFLINILIFIFANFQFMMHLYDKSRNQSIEFLEEGIRIFKRKNSFHHFKYVLSALINQHYKYQKFYFYQDIEKLVVQTRQRFIPLYSLGTGGPSTDMYEVDITLYFSDGETYFLLGPETFNNDSQLIGHILTEKIPNIVDPDNILTAYQNKINLTDYMTSQKSMISR